MTYVDCGAPMARAMVNTRDVGLGMAKARSYVNYYLNLNRGLEDPVHMG